MQPHLEGVSSSLPGGSISIVQVTMLHVTQTTINHVTQAMFPHFLQAQVQSPVGQAHICTIGSAFCTLVMDQHSDTSSNKWPWTMTPTSQPAFNIIN